MSTTISYSKLIIKYLAYITLSCMALFISGCTTIEIEATDLSPLQAEKPRQSAVDTLGKPEAIVKKENFFVEYFEINKGFQGKYKPGKFAGLNTSASGDAALLLAPLWTMQMLVAVGEQASQRRAARESQKAGLIVFRESSGKIDYVVKTRVLLNKNESLDLFADLFRNAMKGDPEALVILGAAGLNDKRRYAFICNSTHRSNIIAMELLAGGIYTNRFPSEERKHDSLFWFALAHPTYVMDQISRLPEEDNDVELNKEYGSAHQQIEKLRFEKYNHINELISWRRPFSMRYAVAGKFDERLASLSSEDRSNLMKRVESWEPSLSDCPNL